MALYCPIYGYYEKEADIIGRAGDYYTNVSVGSLYGELLAWQFAQWLESSPGLPQKRANPNQLTLRLVEGGAHRGELAKDILGWLRRHRPALFDRAEYCIVEPSTRRETRQRETLKEYSGRIMWVKKLAELGNHGQKFLPEGDAGASGEVRTIIFSNELLDAFPVHRFGWDAAQHAWFEWGVTAQDEKFVWTRMAPTFAVPKCPPELAKVLPDGFTLEVCPSAVQWWREAAQLPSVLKLLTVDYGLTLEERFAPHRQEGTLRAYRRHQFNADVLAHPGEQDITAHVDFTTLQQTGVAVGLRTEQFVTQAQFLTGILADISKGPAGFGDWTSERTRQFQTLTHPEHLGRAFRVLVQAA